MMVIVPVSACWAKAAVPMMMMVKAAIPAIIIAAIFMAVSQLLNMRDKPR